MTESDDPFQLERFIEAQHGVYEDALTELRRRRKTSHWMWFIFPQVAGLGSSAMAVRHAISSLAEARAYLNHPVLGRRLRDCASALTEHTGRSAHAILGSPDDLKLKSSMTLFAQAAPDEPLFGQVLDTYFDGERDPLTLARLREA